MHKTIRPSLLIALALLNSVAGADDASRLLAGEEVTRHSDELVQLIQSGESRVRCYSNGTCSLQSNDISGISANNGTDRAIRMIGLISSNGGPQGRIASVDYGRLGNGIDGLRVQMRDAHESLNMKIQHLVIHQNSIPAIITSDPAQSPFGLAGELKYPDKKYKLGVTIPIEVIPGQYDGEHCDSKVTFTFGCRLSHPLFFEKQEFEIDGRRISACGVPVRRDISIVLDPFYVGLCQSHVELDLNITGHSIVIGDALIYMINAQ